MKPKTFTLLIVFVFSFSAPVLAHKNFSIEIPSKASANGKYKKLKQILQCKSDRAKYGAYKDYGYWGGGAWCGNTGLAGYWVWVSPNWYIWSRKR